MPGRKLHLQFTESEYAKDLVKIMQAGTGLIHVRCLLKSLVSYTQKCTGRTL